MNHAPVKDLITLKDLARIDIRVGTITDVAEVAASDKLMKLTVDFGDHVRTILAGIKKERANPYEIEGRQANDRKACCSTSVMRMVTRRVWPYPNGVCRVEAGRAESDRPSGDSVAE